MTEYIFVRHGKSQANQDGVIAADDSPLTEEGQAQARETASHFKASGVRTIASSPLVRARQTAEIIAAELGIPAEQIQVVDGLRERNFGALVGGPKTHESEWYYTVEVPGIEPRADLLARMHACHAQLGKLAETAGPLLAVGHATSGFYLQQAALGKKDVATLDPPTQITNAGSVRLPVGEANIPTEHNDDIYKAGGIIIKDRKVLFARSTGTEYFIDPGGKIEPGESPQAALVRELKEELNIDVAETDLVSFGSFSAEAANHPGRTVHMEVFMVKQWQGEPAPTTEVEEIRWLTHELPTDIKVGSIFGHQVLPRLHEQGLVD
jgi:mutator protein MutT